MERQEMIDKIYEKIADKTLSFGCKCKYDIWEKSVIIWKPYNIWKISISYKWHDVSEDDDIYSFDNQKNMNNFSTLEVEKENLLIIGHPVMIWDVFEYIWNINLKNSIWKEDIVWIHNHKVMVDKLWKEKRKPIDEQSEECIEYVYNLIK